jgi:regulator of sigma E protease
MAITSFLITIFELALVVLGFSAIIFVHELGHFIAARWAGIRVLAFAIGFGSALVSYRKGLGWRRGSSEEEYHKLVNARAAGVRTTEGRPGTYHGMSPTEYRLNVLPLGGYVKMLGQDDLDPTKVSDAPDSYQNCPPWKRMIVISAGVAMNLISAAALFIIVFMIGLQTEPAKIGGVAGPAAKTVAVNAPALGVEKPGLQPGDVVLEVNGREPNSFNDVYLASAMAKRDKPVKLTVRRAGVEGDLRFDVLPEESPLTGLLAIGVEPARSPRIFDTPDEASADQFEQRMAELGIHGVRPGMRLVRAGPIDHVTSAHDLEIAMEQSGGKPVPVAFEGDGGTRAEGLLTPQPELMLGVTRTARDREATFEHLLGLTPVIRVGPMTEQDRGHSLGLREGDVFALLGTTEYPNIGEGIREIRNHAGRDIDMVLLRGPNHDRVELRVPVRKDGTIGFGVDDTGRDDTLLAMTPAKIMNLGADEPVVPAAADVISMPGMRVLRIDDVPVSNFFDIRNVLRAATEDALALQRSSGEVSLEVELPLAPVSDERVKTIPWTLRRADVQHLHDLGWLSPMSTALFEPEEFELKASGPLEAVSMGLDETQRVMLTTYATFDRLFAGTVKVEHLKGPVGIAHLGTRILDRGTIWFIFFMALISVNLAVINFLPLPIVDGGQFILLLIEQVRGRPVPVAIQNAISMAGLVLIGGVFLLVTFNDIKAILGV